MDPFPRKTYNKAYHYQYQLKKYGKIMDVGARFIEPEREINKSRTGRINPTPTIIQLKFI